MVDVFSTGGTTGSVATALPAQEISPEELRGRGVQTLTSALDPTVADQLDALIEGAESQDVEALVADITQLDRPQIKALADHLARLSLFDDALELAAEDHHYASSSTRPRLNPGSIFFSLLQRHEPSAARAKADTYLAELTISITDTNHPTHYLDYANRQVHLRLRQALSNSLGREGLPADRQEALESALAELTQAKLQRSKPDVEEEDRDARNTMIHGHVPALLDAMQRLSDDYETAFGEPLDEGVLMQIFHRSLRCWRADMDGNKFRDSRRWSAIVHADIDAMVGLYNDGLAELRAQLDGTLSAQMTHKSSSAPEGLTEARAAMRQTTELEQWLSEHGAPNLKADLDNLEFDIERGEGAEFVVQNTYDELQRRLDCLLDTLPAEGPLAAAHRLARRLRRMFGAFGLHLSGKEVRHDCIDLTKAVAGLPGLEGCMEGDEEAPDQTRYALIDEALATIQPLSEEVIFKDHEGDPPQSEPQRTLQCMRRMVRMQEVCGEHTADLFYMSRVRGPEDVLAILALAKAAGVFGKFDLVLLFETHQDTLNSLATMEVLYAHPLYREHLALRGNIQRFMPPYSDNGKDGGTALAMFDIQWNFQKLHAQGLTQDIGTIGPVTVIKHNGRGLDSPARGGGPRDKGDLLITQPPESIGTSVYDQTQGRVDGEMATPASRARFTDQWIGAGMFLALHPNRESLADAWRSFGESTIHERGDVVALHRNLTGLDGQTGGEDAFAELLYGYWLTEALKCLPCGARPVTSKQIIRAISSVAGPAQSGIWLPLITLGTFLQSVETRKGTEWLDALLRDNTDFFYLRNRLLTLLPGLVSLDLEAADALVADAPAEVRQLWEHIRDLLQLSIDQVNALRERHTWLDEAARAEEAKHKKRRARRKLGMAMKVYCMREMRALSEVDASDFGQAKEAMKQATANPNEGQQWLAQVLAVLMVGQAAEQGFWG